MAQELFFLIVLHYIGDFPMQGAYLAENKGKDDYLLFAHSTIWAGIICFGLLFFGMFAPWKALFLLAGHFVVDRWKARKVNATYEDLLKDQLIHLMQLVIVVML